MKRLRILTGSHSGAQVELVPGDYRIGPGDDVDVCITDWSELSILLSLDAAGIMRWTSASAGSSSAAKDDASSPVYILVQELVPIPFGDVVLCVGPQDEAWPADVDILRTLWVSAIVPGESTENLAAAATKPAWLRGRALGITFTVGMLGAVLVVAATLFGTPPHNAVAMANPQTLATRITEALHTASIAGLHVVPRDSTVVVQGMVATSAEDVAARSVFQHVTEDQSQIQRQYDVAEDDRRNLQDALGISGIQVSYLGDSNFEVSGTVPSLAVFQTALTRVRSDLDANLKQIKVAVTELPLTQASADYSEIMTIGDARYAETPDGVKHLYPAEAKAKVALEHPAHAQSALKTAALKTSPGTTAASENQEFN